MNALLVSSRDNENIGTIKDHVEAICNRLEQLCCEFADACLDQASISLQRLQ